MKNLRILVLAGSVLVITLSALAVWWLILDKHLYRSTEKVTWNLNTVTYSTDDIGIDQLTKYARVDVPDYDSGRRHSFSPDYSIEYEVGKETIEDGANVVTHIVVARVTVTLADAERTFYLVPSDGVIEARICGDEYLKSLGLSTYCSEGEFPSSAILDMYRDEALRVIPNIRLYRITSTILAEPNLLSITNPVTTVVEMVEYR